ncbi:TPA: hypothetical protein DCY65_01610 [Candidatus Acetothermia bacterium]|nr:hypothetical protein [Candidatus Acetothermia bacterium]HAZ30252.1 hypothetical protein [Candidatus Acetothermia bacterium]
MLRPVKEAVDVGVVFPARKPHPVPRWFVWRGQRYIVEAVHLVHEQREGAIRYLIYSLTAGGTALQLRFDPEHVRWYVDGVFVEEG